MGAAFVGANRAITLWRFKHVPVARPWRRVAEVLAVVALNSAAKFWLSRVAGTCLRVPKAGTGADGGDALTYFVGKRSFCAEGEYNDLASLFLVPSEDAIGSSSTLRPQQRRRRRAVVATTTAAEAHR